MTDTVLFWYLEAAASLAVAVSLVMGPLKHKPPQHGSRRAHCKTSVGMEG